jgi:L-ascorbate metabolism protein UlaG (beta-lactamase superfamily)
MKITKFVHSCLLVETPERVAIFDPGVMSYQVFNFDNLNSLDDIFITHIHEDHLHIPFIKELVTKFPNVRVTSTNEVVAKLKSENIIAHNEPPEGVTYFESPHESVAPLLNTPDEIGVHYLNILTVPGDSHNFHETKDILAIPITAPWGSSIRALNVILELKPKYVIPVHDWHWSEQARTQSYEASSQLLGEKGIKMYKPETGQPIDISG